MSTTYLNVPKNAVIPKYTTLSSAPITGNAGGDVIAVLDTDKLYIWDSTTSAWVPVSQAVSITVTDTNSVDMTIVANDIKSDVRIQDTNTVDLGIDTNGVKADVKYVDSTSINFSDSASGLTGSVIIQDTNTVDLGIDSSGLKADIKYVDSNSINISDSASGLTADVVIQDTNTVDLTINASGLKGDIKYQDSTSINLSDNTSGLKAELLINDTNSIDLTLGASGLEAAVRSQDTNSIDFGVDGSGIKADVKLSSVVASTSNQKVDLDIQTDGIRAQIPDSSINTAITKGNLSETTSSVLTIGSGTNAVLGTGTTISVAQSGASLSGYLSTGDWNIFNSKQKPLARIWSADATNGVLAINGANGQTIPFKQLDELLTALETEVLTRITGGETRTDCKYIINVAPGTYSQNLTIPSIALLQFNMSGATISGNITRVVQQTTGWGADYYSYVAFNGSSGIRLEKGHQSLISGNVTTTTGEGTEYLYYTSFSGIELAGNMTTTIGVNVTLFDRVTHYDNTKVLHGNGTFLLEIINRSEIKASITGTTLLYNCLDSDLYVININPNDESNFYNMTFNDTISISNSTIKVDGVSHKNLLAMSPTLTGSTISIKEQIATSSISGILTSGDWNTFNGKEPALAKTNLTETTSSILTITNGTGAVIGSSPVTVAVQQANTTLAGYLSSADWNTFNGKAAAADVTALQNIHTNSLEPTGFLSTNDGKPNTSCSLAFTNTSPDRTLTITVSSGSYDFYVKGVKFTKTTSQTCQITDVEGLHYIYFNSSGNLVETTTFVSALITENALVAIVYWDATNKAYLMLCDERHQISMDGASHLLHHTTQGSDYASGAALNTFTIGNGSADTHAQFGVDAGAMHDEDLFLVLNPVLVANGCPIFYKLGASGAWRKVINAGFSITTTGTGRMAWNQYTAGAWKLTEVTSNNYALCHIFMTNDPSQPYIAIVGQGEYATANIARTNANIEIGALVTSGLPAVEFIPVASVIFQTNNGYANAVKSKIVLTDTGNNYEDFRFSFVTSTVASPSAHGSLSGLNADDHPQYYLKGTGGLNEFSFSTANNQVAAADVTGFLFANATVRSFKAQVSVYIDAGTDLHELFDIAGIQLGADWVITVESIGEESGITFSITALGQVQYTSTNVASFVSGTMKIKALTTGVL